MGNSLGTDVSFLVFSSTMYDSDGLMMVRSSMGSVVLVIMIINHYIKKDVLKDE